MNLGIAPTAQLRAFCWASLSPTMLAASSSSSESTSSCLSVSSASAPANAVRMALAEVTACAAHVSRDLVVEVAVSNVSAADSNTAGASCFCAAARTAAATFFTLLLTSVSSKAMGFRSGNPAVLVLP